MKIISTIIAITVLTVSLAPAQQAPISSAERQQVVQKAKEDASKDVNIPLSVFTGFGCSFLTCAAHTVFTMDLWIFPPGPTDRELAGQVCMAGSLGCLLAIIPSMTMKVSPPASRLLGKSPAYVRIYAQAYKSEIVRKRLIGTSIGSAAGVGLLLTILYVVRVDD